MRKFLEMVHVCAKFHENQKGSGFFFVDLVWNDPIMLYKIINCQVDINADNLLIPS